MINRSSISFGLVKKITKDGGTQGGKKQILEGDANYLPIGTSASALSRLRISVVEPDCRGSLREPNVLIAERSTTISPGDHSSSTPKSHCRLPPFFLLSRSVSGLRGVRQLDDLNVAERNVRRRVMALDHDCAWFNPQALARILVRLTLVHPVTYLVAVDPRGEV